MTVLDTLRFALKKYTSGGDPHPTRDEHNVMIDAIENNAVMGAQGVTDARPAAGKGRRVFWDETVGRLWYDDGANWKDLNPNGGGGAGSTIAPGTDGTEGTSNRAARADHTHKLPLATPTAHGAMSSADKTKLDGAASPATPDRLALRDASGRLSVGTPTDPAEIREPSSPGIDAVRMLHGGAAAAAVQTIVEPSSGRVMVRANDAGGLTWGPNAEMSLNFTYYVETVVV